MELSSTKSRGHPLASCSSNSHICFRAGGGRFPRQPGQVGNEAALTIRRRVVRQPFPLFSSKYREFSLFFAISTNIVDLGNSKVTSGLLPIQPPPRIYPTMAKTTGKSQGGRKSGQKASSPEPGKNPPSLPYVVLARKYRPKAFGDLIGQDALVVTLKNAFEAGRIAQAYMLTGVRGVGKTTTARILARALNFEKDGAPNTPTTDLPIDKEQYGRHCADIMASRHPDVLEMDAASNTGVDNIREIIESSRYKPLIARYKVFIIDEVHMLSKGAFNALLKTLEEPPEHVKFIFATTEIRKVPLTVLSRCQRFDLRRVDVEELVSHFKKIIKAEGATAEDDALAIIARAAEGSVRDGLSILDQAIAFQKAHVKESGVRTMLGLADRGRIFDLLEHILSGRAKEALEGLSSLHKDGSEPTRILEDLAEVVHLTTKVKATGTQQTFEGITAQVQRRAIALSEKVSVPLLARAWQMLLKGIEETSRAPTPLSAAEMVLIRMAFTADLPTPEKLIKTIAGESISTRSTANSPPSNAKNTTPTATQSSSADNQQPPPQDTHKHSSAPNSESVDDGHEGNLGYDIDTTLSDELQISTGDLRPNPKSFQDVLDLVGLNRDAKLKVYLEENVSLVKFDPETNAIDLHLLPGAPQTIANELREKLNQWTGCRWIVMLSKEPGDLPVAEVKRKKLQAEIEQLKQEPEIKAALETFPDAKIVDITPLETKKPDDEEQADTA